MDCELVAIALLPPADRSHNDECKERVVRVDDVRFCCPLRPLATVVLDPRLRWMPCGFPSGNTYLLRLLLRSLL